MSIKRNTQRVLGWLLTFAVLLGTLPGNLPVAYAEDGGGVEIVGWNDLYGTPGEGRVAIIFDANDGMGETRGLLQGGGKYTRYIDPEKQIVTLPRETEIGTADGYNLQLTGWYLVNDQGDNDTSSVDDKFFFTPGQEVSLRDYNLDKTGKYTFYAVYEVGNYNFGDPNALGGTRETVKSNAIITKIFDVSTLFNAPRMMYDSYGNWQDQGNFLFVDDYTNAGSLVQSEGFTSKNRWTGKVYDSGYWVTPGLWDTTDIANVFDESGDTFGVTYVGDASNGSLFWREENGLTYNGKDLSGYYVYDSDVAGASYNQSDSRFDVYKKPQIFISDSEENRLREGFFPFNYPTDDSNYYMYNNGTLNYHFAMSTEVDFFLPSDVGSGSEANRMRIDPTDPASAFRDMEFFFSGDDDVWVFIDDQLVLDLGGIHSRVEGSINFNSGKVSRGYRDNGIYKENGDNDLSIKNMKAGNHTLKVYYMERGGNVSNNLTAFLLIPYIDFDILKLDAETREPVIATGAEFVLQNADGKYYKRDEPNDLGIANVEYVDDPKDATVITIDEDGMGRFHNLIDGTYFLTEKTPPDYYWPLSETGVMIRFKVLNEEVQDAALVKEKAVLSDPNNFGDPANFIEGDQLKDHISATIFYPWTDTDENFASDTLLEVINERMETPIKIKKVNEDNKGLDEVAFTVYELIDTAAVEGKKEITLDPREDGEWPEEYIPIYKGATNSEGEIKTTDANGETHDLALKAGSIYYIVENSLQGYESLTAPIVLKVSGKKPDDIKVELVSDPDSADFTFTDNQGNKTAALNFNDSTLTVTNKVVDPEKKINDQKDPVKLENRDEEFTYTVTQMIPEQAVSAEFEDTLEEVLEIVGTPTIRDAGGNEIAEATVAVDGQKVTATIGEVEELWGQEVTLTIQAKIRDNVTDAQLITKYGNAREIPNKATVTIDGRGKATNEVKVTPPPEPREDPEKETNGQKGLVELETRNQIFTYTVAQVISADAKSATFEDVLEDVLEIIDEPTIDAKDATIEVDGQKVTATLNEKALEAVLGKTVTLTIKAKIKDGVTDEQLVAKYGSTKVPNKATVTVNDVPKTTNEVIVTPPQDPIKRINQVTGTVNLQNRTEEFVYTITQLIPDNATKIVFEDTLEDVLEILATPAGPVVSANEQDVFDGNSQQVDNAVVNISGNKVTATLTGDTATSVHGKYVTLLIRAKIRNNVTDEQLIAKYGSTNVPNTGSVAFNNNPAVDTNTVYVNPPDEDFKPEKTINGKVGTVTLGARAEKFTYEVTQRIPSNAEKVVFSDTLEDVLEIVEKPELSAEGASINVDGNTVTATLDGQSAINARGKLVTLTIQAKIRDSVTDEQLIEKYGSTEVPNEATVTINGNPKVTNVVKVTPPDVPDGEPEKLVNGHTGTEELTARGQEFVYTVKQVIPDNATKAEFSDTLEDVLQIIGTPALNVPGGQVDVSGNAVNATLSGDAIIAARGQEVTLTIHAKIKDSVTDADLIEKYGSTEVPNEATVAINGNPKTTNEVKVTPPEEPEPEEPTKLINGIDGTVTLGTRTEEFTYTISQFLPDNAVSAVFEDTLVDELEVIGTPTIDASGAVVSVNGNAVKATLGKTATEAVRGKLITLTIKAKIKDGVTDEQLIAKYGDAKQIPNVATVSINDNPKKTNEVSVTPPDEPTESPVKKVNGQTDPVKLKTRDEVFTYTVEQAIPSTAKSAAFEDVLKDELEIVGSPTIDAKDAKIQVDGQKITATLEENAVAAVRGKTVTLTIKAKIKDGVTDEQLIEKYGSNTVPNKATVSINDKSQTTNEVLVIPPNEPKEPTKEINGFQGGITLKERTEGFTYTINQRVTDDATKIVVTDELESVLEITEKPVVTANGAVVAGAEVSVSGNTVTATVEGADATDVRGKILTLTIKAKIKEGVTDEQLIAKYGDAKQIPNVATVSINDNPKKTNEVSVTPPDEPEPTPTPGVNEPVKKINGGTAKVVLKERSEQFTYTISRIIAKDATKVVFTDALEDVLEIVGTPTLTTADGEVAGVEAKVDGNTVSATLTDAQAEAVRGKEVTLTIIAKIKDGVTDEQLIAKYGSTDIPNKATVSVNDDGKVTNEVLVTPTDNGKPPKTPSGNVTTSNGGKSGGSTTTTRLPKTGDAQGLALYLGIVLLAICGILVLLFARRKTNK